MKATLLHSPAREDKRTLPDRKSCALLGSRGCHRRKLLDRVRLCRCPAMALISVSALLIIRLAIFRIDEQILVSAHRSRRRMVRISGGDRRPRSRFERSSSCNTRRWRSNRGARRSTRSSIRKEAQTRPNRPEGERRQIPHSLGHSATHDALRLAQKMEAVGQLTGAVHHRHQRVKARLAPNLDAVPLQCRESVSLFTRAS
jgi:hypothetical protein